MTLKVEEELNTQDGYAIFVNNEEVFRVREKEITINDCLNIITLLKQFHTYGRDNHEIVFGIRDTVIKESNDDRKR